MVVAPPGMQQWVRQMDDKVKTLSRVVDRLTGAGTSSYGTYSSEEASAVTAGQGATPAELWYRIFDNGPAVRVSGPARRVKVTVSAMIEAVRTGTGPVSAIGAMRPTLAREAVLASSQVVDNPYDGALVFPFTYPSGPSVPQMFMASFSKYLQIPEGTYTVHSEYIYRQYTENVRVRWSQRSILVEPA